nr:unnamed protein product [Digitaria exilis]
MDRTAAPAGPVCGVTSSIHRQTKVDSACMVAWTDACCPGRPIDDDTTDPPLIYIRLSQDN